MRIAKVNSGIAINVDDVSSVVFNKNTLQTIIALKSGLTFASSLTYQQTIESLLKASTEPDGTLVVFTPDLREDNKGESTPTA